MCDIYWTVSAGHPLCGATGHLGLGRLVPGTLVCNRTSRVKGHLDIHPEK